MFRYAKRQRIYFVYIGIVDYLSAIYGISRTVFGSITAFEGLVVLNNPLYIIVESECWRKFMY